MFIVLYNLVSWPYSPQEEVHRHLDKAVAVLAYFLHHLELVSLVVTVVAQLWCAVFSAGLVWVEKGEEVVVHELAVAFHPAL